MSLFDQILGLEKIHDRLDRIEFRLAKLEELEKAEVEPLELGEEKVLQLLKEPLTTEEVASRLKKSRGWASLLLNRLERKGRVKESEKKGRELLYVRI